MYITQGLIGMFEFAKSKFGKSYGAKAKFEVKIGNLVLMILTIMIYNNNQLKLLRCFYDPFSIDLRRSCEVATLLFR